MREAVLLPRRWRSSISERRRSSQRSAKSSTVSGSFTRRGGAALPRARRVLRRRRVVEHLLVRPRDGGFHALAGAEQRVTREGVGREGAGVVAPPERLTPREFAHERNRLRVGKRALHGGDHRVREDAVHARGGGRRGVTRDGIGTEQLLGGEAQAVVDAEVEVVVAEGATHEPAEMQEVRRDRGKRARRVDDARRHGVVRVPREQAAERLELVAARTRQKAAEQGEDGLDPARRGLLRRAGGGLLLLRVEEEEAA